MPVAICTASLLSHRLGYVKRYQNPRQFLQAQLHKVLQYSSLMLTLQDDFSEVGCLASHLPSLYCKVPLRERRFGTPSLALLEFISTGLFHSTLPSFHI